MLLLQNKDFPVSVMDCKTAIDAHVDHNGENTTL